MSEKVPIPQSRPIKELLASINHSQILSHRSTYNGPWETGVIKAAKKPLRASNIIQEHEFILPQTSYTELLPISEEKYTDLKHLEKFCTEEFAAYIAKVPVKKK